MPLALLSDFEKYPVLVICHNIFIFPEIYLFSTPKWSEDV